MRRRGWLKAPLACIAHGLAMTAVAPAQSPPAAPSVNADEAVEGYMEGLGMTRLLAETLAIRLKAASGEERVRIAERLGKMYVTLLTAATSGEEQRLWEQRGRDLLRDVPESDTWDLRLNLNKAVYIRAEDQAERVRLRLADAAEAQEAERTLRSLEPQFTDIAIKAHRRTEQLERIENAGDVTDALTTELSEARRLRSLAFYYAGWSHYYIGMLARTEGSAVEALRCFGWLLNSPNGRPASPDRMPAALLRYEHVARAAIGSAMSCGLRGNDGDAIRWLDAIEESDDISQAIRDQLVSRRIIVLGESKRWADLEFFLRKARKADRTGGGPTVEPLSVAAARLLAVIVLEADRRIAREQIEGLARIALGDLVARSEVRQVLDLVRRYGTAPIGESGFIVNYVRGLVQFDQARAAHRALDAGGEKPTTDAKTANLYRAAAAMLESAVNQPDAETFRVERAEAALALGRCEYFAGNVDLAGEKFALAFELSGGADGGAQAEEALWLAIVAMDEAARSAAPTAGRSAQRRTELAALFLKAFAGSERAARVVLLQAAAGGGGEAGEEEALRVLSEVPRGSPVYAAARRQVAQMLYTRMRSATGTERDFAALRFVGVSEELIAEDRRIALSGEAVEARKAAERVVVRARQMLDALLGGASPDAARAQSVMEVVQSVAESAGLELGAHEAELLFRRVQIALARDQEAEAAMLAERLAAMATGPAAGAGGAQFAPAADRLIYRRAANQWKRSQTPALAARIVQYGRRIIERARTGAGGEAGALADAGIAGLYSTVASAATLLARDGAEPAMRELAISLDRALLAAQPRLEEALRRLAGNAEDAEDVATAVDCWRTILGASKQGTAAWFEARYQSVRLVKMLDAARARELLDQHKLLYPDFGPAPWGERLRELDRELPTARPAEPDPPAKGGGR